jgi:pyridoxine kinase
MLASNKNEIYKITTPELPLGFGVAGTGDMTTAVFLSRYLETGGLKPALERCAASVFGILEASYKNAPKEKDMPLELRIIDAQEEFISPSYSFKAEKIQL